MGNTTSYFEPSTESAPTGAAPKSRSFHNEEEQFRYYIKEIESIITAECPHKLCYTTPENALQIVAKEGPTRCPDSPFYLPVEPINFKAVALPEKYNKPELVSKIRGLIIGQAVGDAVGLATEFLNKKQAFWKYNNTIDYANYLRDSHRSVWMDDNWVCSDWTDDTDNMLLLLDGVIFNNGDVIVEDYALRLRHWIEFGFSEFGDLGAMGVGKYFGKVVRTPGWVKDPVQVSKKMWEESNKSQASNGCIMKIGILGAVHFWEEERVKENSAVICRTTHYDERCVASCLVICTIIAESLKAEKSPDDILEYALLKGKEVLTLESNIEQFDTYTHANKLEELDLCNCIGFVYKTLGCAIWALRKYSACVKEGVEIGTIFEQIITEITMEAGDADTNSAVAGTVIGSFLGDQNIPEKWKKLRHIDALEHRIQSFLHIYNL
ncbi:hypothetical protein EIN_019280 [Entamoeba invadens IP1]|uniref:ADP-ribosylglycohydrolase n=1 Tax=Entamoeba invadens TaxID=33085 RepID=S0AY40_ENTIV|nr:hypothetical protein EIN_019280 [Entamoeba invadens IP1]ELP90539.1 hypothetical protein EIN_019280 [Entamoeba invadens IP1]BAN40395.1 hypothetical protein, conserved [Entamoeba invadens]|eukprot:XP_004257310.1 hypothetical protein EIN_019280 [Entamoeba invadens IP1]